VLIELTLLIALAQSPRQSVNASPLPPSHLVALVFSDTDTQFARLDDSQRLYDAIEAKRLAGTWNDDDRRLYTALTIALGTLPDRERLSVPRLGTRERLDWEVRRGVRLPVQEREKD
jgi:hypothetical protein